MDVFIPNGIGLVFTQREVTISRLPAHSLNSYRSNKLRFLTGQTKKVNWISATLSRIEYFQSSPINRVRSSVKKSHSRSAN